MNNYLIVTTLLLSFSQLNLAKLPTLPNGYPYREDFEAVYKYKYDGKVSIMIVQMAANYNFDVITRPGTESNQLYVIVENVEYSDSINDPNEQDINALKIPFIIYLDNNGDWTKVKMSPNETAISLDIKDNIINTLTFNGTDITGGLTEDKEGSEEEWMDEIPLGEMCNVKTKLTSIPNEYVISVKAIRNKCTGKSLLSVEDKEITPDSTVDLVYRFLKSPFQFKKSEMAIDVTINMFPKVKTKIGLSVEFMQFRPLQAQFDIGSLTETYTPEQLPEKMEALKGESDEN